MAKKSRSHRRRRARNRRKRQRLSGKQRARLARALADPQWWSNGNFNEGNPTYADMWKELEGLRGEFSKDSVNQYAVAGDDPISYFSQGIIVGTGEGSGDDDWYPVFDDELVEGFDGGNMAFLTGDRIYRELVPDDEAPPATPTGLTADAGIGSIILNWDANTEIDMVDGYGMYYLEVNTDAAFDVGSIVYEGEVGVTFFTVSNLTTSTAHYARVKAIDAHSNESAWSASASATPRTITVPDIDVTVPTVPQDNATPANPASLTLTGGIGSIIAKWTANSEIDMAAGYGLYTLELNTDSGFGAGTKVHEENYTATSVVVTGLTTGTTYYGRVSATDAHGNTSGWSASANAAPIDIEAGDLGTSIDEVPNDGGNPATPTGMTVDAGFQTLFIRWNNNTEVDMEDHWGSYQIQVATDTGFTSIVADVEQKANYCVIPDLTTSTTYYVRLRAIDAHGNLSGWNTYDSGAPVQILTVDITTGAITNDKIADFAVAAKQFNTTLHILY